MPKDVHEITDFTLGTITTPSERDIPDVAAAYSLNIDSIAEEGKLSGVPVDRLVKNLSQENYGLIESWTYGVPWSSKKLWISDISALPPSTTDGNSSRIMIQGNRGIHEILTYSNKTLHSDSIRSSYLKVLRGASSVDGVIESFETQLLLVNDGDTKTLSNSIFPPVKIGDSIIIGGTGVALSENNEWMKIVALDNINDIITVERAVNNTPLKSYADCEGDFITVIDTYKGSLTVSGWQTNYEGNHIGQSPIIIYTVDASADSNNLNLVHDSSAKSITLSSHSIVANIGSTFITNPTHLENLISNKEIITIIHPSGYVTVYVDYMADGVIYYSKISGTLSNLTTGKYYIDCNKIPNGCFRQYIKETSTRQPDVWTINNAPGWKTSYDYTNMSDAAHPHIRNTVGYFMLKEKGGLTDNPGQEYDTANSTYDQPSNPFLVMGNSRSGITATILNNLQANYDDNIVETTYASSLNVGDTLILSDTEGTYFSNVVGTPYSGGASDRYNYFGRPYGVRINVISLVGQCDNNDKFTAYISKNVGGEGKVISITFKTSLISAPSDSIYVKTQSTGDSAADAAYAKDNLLMAINGGDEAGSFVSYGTSTGESTHIGDFQNGIKGMQAFVSSNVPASVLDIFSQPSEEYVKVIQVNPQSNTVKVKRAIFGNLVKHFAAASFDKTKRYGISISAGGDGFPVVQPGKKYRLTWYCMSVSNALLKHNNSDDMVQARLNFKIGFAGGYISPAGKWSDSLDEIGDNGELTWRDSSNFVTQKDSLAKTSAPGINTSLMVDLFGDRGAFLTDDSARANWVRIDADFVGVPHEEQLGFFKYGNKASFVAESGDTQYDKTYLLGDAQNIVQDNGATYSTASPALPSFAMRFTAHDAANLFLNLNNGVGNHIRFQAFDTAYGGSANDSMAYFQFAPTIPWAFHFYYAESTHNLCLSSTDGTWERFRFGYTDSSQLGLTQSGGGSNGTLHNQNQVDSYCVVSLGVAKEVTVNGGTLTDNFVAAVNGSLLSGKITATKVGSYGVRLTQNLSGVGQNPIVNPGIRVDSNGIPLPPLVASGYSMYGAGMENLIWGPKTCTWFGGNSNNSQGFYNPDFTLNGRTRAVTDGGGNLFIDGGNSDQTTVTYGDKFAQIARHGFCTKFAYGTSIATVTAALEAAIEHVNGFDSIEPTVTAARTTASASNDTITITNGNYSTEANTAIAIEGGEYSGSGDSATLSAIDYIASIPTTYSGGIGIYGASFEFYDAAADADNADVSMFMWNKCETDFVVPIDKTCEAIDISFEQDGQVIGTKDGTTTSDRWSSLIGLDGVKLEEINSILPFNEQAVEISGAETLSLEGDKELLIYHDKSNQTINAISDFGDPLDGSENILNEYEYFPYSSAVKNFASFTKNNREFHIGLGSGDSVDTPVWAGFLNHKQFGKDLSNTFYIGDSIVPNYDTESSANLDKIVQASEWECTPEFITISNDDITFHIDDHNLKVNDNIIVRQIYNTKTHIKTGNYYDPSTRMNQPIHSYKNSIYPIKEITSEGYIKVTLNESPDSTATDINWRIRPYYYYGIVRGETSIYRINPIDGKLTRGDGVGVPLYSICTPYCKIDGISNQIGGTGYLGGRVWVLDQPAERIYRVNIAYTNYEAAVLHRECTLIPSWNTWWSSTDLEEATDSDYYPVEKQISPLNRGVMSDIHETWGLKGRTDSLDNNADTRMWVQFYPKQGDTFGAFDSFMYCANTSEAPLSGQYMSQFCNRTIPMPGTGIGDDFDPNKMFGRTGSEQTAWGINNSGTNWKPSGMIAKFPAHNLLSGTTEYAWCNSGLVSFWWWLYSPSSLREHTNYQRYNGVWTGWYHQHDNIPLYEENHAENIGWDDPSPSYKVPLMGLVGIPDNDNDGLIDGTGLPVSSAVNVNIGLKIGRDCSSHVCALMVEANSEWILTGSTGGHWGSSFHQRNNLNSLASYLPDYVGKWASNPQIQEIGLYMMVTSDLWEQEKASKTTDSGVPSGGAMLIRGPDNDLFFNKATSKEHHWSATSDANAFSDKFYVMKTADKHHLSIGNPFQTLALHDNKVLSSAHDNWGTNDFASPSPVAGIIDDYHFIIKATRKGEEDPTATSPANFHWKVAPALSGNYGYFTGERRIMPEDRVEGFGVKFFSDWLHWTRPSTLAYYGDAPNAVHTSGCASYSNSLLKWRHARMIRPFSAVSETGSDNVVFNNKNSVSIPSMPDNVYGMDYDSDTQSQTTSYQTKLFVSTPGEGDFCNLYSFDWTEIFTDESRYQDYVNWSDDRFRNHSICMFHGRIHDKSESGITSADSSHDGSHEHNYKGKMRIVSTLDTAKTNPGTANQNLYIPGTVIFTQQDGLYPGNATNAGIGTPNLFSDQFITMPPQGLQGNQDTGFFAESIFVSRGMLIDFIAVHYPGKATDYGETVGNNRRYVEGRTEARQIIESYTVDVEGDEDNDILRAQGYGSHEKLFDHTNDRVCIRTHYPWGRTPSSSNENDLSDNDSPEDGQETIRLFRARDAAVAPIRISKELLPPYAGQLTPDKRGYCTIKGNPGESTISIAPIDAGYNTSGTGLGFGEPSTLEPTLNADAWNVGDTVVVSGVTSNSSLQYEGTYNVESVSINKIDSTWNFNTSVANCLVYIGNSDVLVQARYTVINNSAKANPIELPQTDSLAICATQQDWWTRHWVDPIDIDNPFTNSPINGIVDPTHFESNPMIDNFGPTGTWRSKSSSMLYTVFGSTKEGKLRDGYTRCLFASPRFFRKSRALLSQGVGKWLTDVGIDGHFANNREGFSKELFEADASLSIFPAKPVKVGNSTFDEFSNYTYKVSLVYDGYQEGPMSETTWRFDDIQKSQNPPHFYDSLNVQVYLANPSKRLTAVCIYRKNDINDLYRLVGEISTVSAWSKTDNLLTASLLDNGALGATFEARAGYSEVLTEPFVKYGMGVSLNGYHFVADCSHSEVKNASHMIFRSLPGMFDLFNWANDFCLLSTKPTAIANFAGRLYVFDNSNTYLINPQTLVIEDTYKGTGCVGMRSVLVTDFGMFYCDKNNAYFHNGQIPEIISQTIKKGGDSDIDANISDFSWDKTAGAPNTMNPILGFDNKRNCVLFFVEKPGDGVGTYSSRYYCWSFSLTKGRWDLWEVSTGNDYSGNFDEKKIVKPGSILITKSGKSFITLSDNIFDYLGGKETKPWEYLTKKLSLGHTSQKKIWKNIKLIGNSDDVTGESGEIDGRIKIMIDSNTIAHDSSDLTYKQESPDGKVTIKGSSKSGKFIQILLTKMRNTLDSLAVVFRRKGIK